MNNTEVEKDSIEAAIFDLLRRRGPRKTICPSEAARHAFHEDQWREKMPEVRASAEHLVREGRLEVCQKGRVVDPDQARGPIRLRLKTPEA